MTHWLWLQLAKCKSVACGSLVAEACTCKQISVFGVFKKRCFIATRI